MRITKKMIVIISILILNSFVITNTTYACYFDTANVKQLGKVHISIINKTKKIRPITEKELIALMKKASNEIIKMCSPSAYAGKYLMLEYRPLDKEFNSFEKIRKKIGVFSTKQYIDYLLKVTSIKVMDKRLCIRQGDFGELPDFSTTKILNVKQSGNSLNVKYHVTYPYAETIIQEIVICLEGQNWKIQSWKAII